MKPLNHRRLMLGLLALITAALVWRTCFTESTAPVPQNESSAPKREARTRGGPRPGPSLSDRWQVLTDSEMAPAWALKYGGEFWNRAESEHLESHSVSPLTHPPFSVGDVIERVNHALTGDPSSGEMRVDAGNYTARFSEQGLRFSPYHLESSAAVGENAVPGRPWPDPETELIFRTISVQRDGSYFYSAGRDRTEWSLLGNTAQALLSSENALVEHYEALAEGIAVTWVLQKPLPGAGAVEVTAEIQGLDYAGETDSGHHFTDQTGVARVRVGRAEAVDAAGTRWDLETRVAMGDPRQLIVELPAEIQAEAVYPLAIDPMIGPEFGMDKPVSSSAQGNDNNPAVANAAGTYLVVWEDNRNTQSSRTDIYGARVTSAGVVLDPFGLQIGVAMQNQTVPAVAANGTTFLVVWQDRRLGGQNDIFGARVTPKGVVADPLGLAISSGTAAKANPTVTAGTNDFLVAWEDNRNSGVSGVDIYGARVSPLGGLLDPAGILICTNTTDQVTPTAAMLGNDYFVAWTDGRNAGTTTDIYGARVSSSGVLLDVTNVALSVALSNQSEPAAAGNNDMVLVVWRDRRTSGTTSDDVYGTRLVVSNGVTTVLDAGGIAISTNNASQRMPAATALTNNFLVVWRDARTTGTTGNDIYGARVDTNGLVLEPTGFTICTNAATQSVPAVSGGPAEALVVWTDSRKADTANDIYGTFVSSAGAVTNTNDIALSLAGAIQTAAAVAFNGTNYLIVWEDHRNFALNGSDIRGARVSPLGKLIDLSGLNIASQTSQQQRPGVGASGGTFLVAWEDDRNAGGTGVDIYGARVSGGGTILDPAGIALSTAANDEATPVVAGNASTFFVAWEDNRNGSAPDIFGTPVSQAGVVGNPAGLTISATGRAEINPTIAANPNQFLVAWEDSNNDVFASRISSAGVVLDTTGNSIQLAGQGTESVPAAAALGTNFLVAWQDSRNFSSDIYASRVFGDGTAADFDGFPVCTLPDDQVNPAVSATSNTWVVVWQDQRPGPSGNDLFTARVSTIGQVLDYTGIPLIGTSDRTLPRLAYGGAGKFLLISDAFRGTNSQRVVASLMNGEPPTKAGPIVQFKSSAFAALESTGVAKVTVAVTGKYSGVVTVDFSTSDGSAIAGTDYLPVVGRLVFSGKKTSQVIAIPLLSDGVVDPNETVVLTLQNATGGVLLGPRHTATLTIQ